MAELKVTIGAFENAFHSVKQAQERVDAIDNEIFEWKQKNPAYLKDEALKAVLEELNKKFHTAKADEHQKSIEMVNARESYLRLVRPKARRFIAPPYIAEPSHANSFTIGGSLWNCNPVNHRIAFDALQMMVRSEEEDMVESIFHECAQEVLDTIAKANRHEDQIGLFYSETSPHEELSITSLMTEILARKLYSYEESLRWYHQLHDATGSSIDIALYTIQHEGPAQGLPIPSAVFEVGRDVPLGNKQWQIFGHIINQSHSLANESQAMLSVEMELNFSHGHSLSLRCASATGERALWYSTIWAGAVTMEALARVLCMLVKGAIHNSKSDQVGWKMLSSSCALDVETSKVYKCFDYRYDESADRPNTSYYIEYLRAQTVIEAANLHLITYDFIEGSHNAESTSDFIPILKMLVSLHSKAIVHGDIRLSNLVFAGEKSSLIDFDFAGEKGKKKYPTGFNQKISNGYRHENAKDQGLLELEHDWYALGMLMMKFFSTKSPSDHDWSAVCDAVFKGELMKAINLLSGHSPVPLQSLHSYSKQFC